MQDNQLAIVAIPGHEGYGASRDGSIWSRRQRNGLLRVEWRMLHSNTTSNGRLQVFLCHNGKAKSFKVHRLVLLAFVGACPNGMEACHNDGNPENNNISNLRWDTKKNNESDKVQHGTHNRGERHNLAKLTTLRVLLSDFQHLFWRVTYQQLSERYMVSVASIYRVVVKKSWEHTEII